MASYAADQLIEVRFQIFFDTGCPVLSWSEVKDMFTPLPFASRHGRRFGSIEGMIAFLNGIGLPGEEIATPFNHEKGYFLTRSQMAYLAKP